MKSRVLHIITDSNIGGAGHHLLALLKNRENAKVVLPIGALLIPSLKKLAIPYVELPHLAEKSFSWKAIRVLLKEMRNFKPEIVHTHAALSGRVAARLYRRCKVVHTRHSVFEPKVWQTRFPMRQLFGALNNALSDAIIAVSPAARDNLLALGVRNRKIHVIFNGMPKIESFPNNVIIKLKKKYNVPPNDFVVVQIARLTEVKGHKDVLDALKNAEDITVLMAGEGELRPLLERRIETENIQNIKLLGFIDEVEEILNIADVQISASFGTEATSLALIQGMSIGLPSVVTDFGGNPYVVEHMENGLVVPTLTPSSIYAAVEKIQSDDDLHASMKVFAMKNYESAFTVEKMVTNTENLYDSIQ